MMMDPCKETEKEGSPTTEQPSCVETDTGKYSTDEEPIDFYVILLHSPNWLPLSDN